MPRRRTDGVAVAEDGHWQATRLAGRAVEKGEPVLLRNPLAIRPWQHVLEPLSGYVVLAQALWHTPNAAAKAWNFGPRDDDAGAERGA